jgi:uncharacterized SAM-binding protein YcdF (DUF218 family)
MYELSKILGTLTTSGGLILAALAVAIMLLWLRRGGADGRAPITMVVIALLLVVATPLQPWLSGQLENRFPADPAVPDHIDGIIILGGMVRPSISKVRGRPTLNDAAERLLEGATLAARFPDAKVVFTGGSANPWDSSLKEAEFAAQALQRMGVAADRLVIEDRSRNTYENALFTRQLLPAHPGETWLLVTSALHLPRSVGVFRQTGWSVLPWPTNFTTGAEDDWANEDVPVLRLTRLSHTLHELIGLVYYRLRGWSDSWFPAP